MLDMNWSSRKSMAKVFRLGYANRLCEDGECVGEAQQYLKDIAQTSAPMSIMMTTDL